MKESRKKTRINIKDGLNNLWEMIKYILLIIIYVFYLPIKSLSSKIKFLKPIQNLIYKMMLGLDRPQIGQLSKLDLIDLSTQNMLSKKNRFSVTVGGITVGIAGIVFLVSIGYGLQSMVINQVARSEEMRQADVSVQPGSKLFLNDETLDSLHKIKNVDLVLPQISVVGKVNFNNSITDMAVYGVTKDYLIQSGITTVKGKIFENNDTKTNIKAEEQKETITPTEADLKDDELLRNLIEVEGESDTSASYIISKVQFPNAIKDRYAIVNRSFLRILNIPEDNALDKTFSATFITTKTSELGVQSRIESSAVDYTIIGVTPDDNTPLFYIPLTHLKVLGIDDYSQVKVVADQDKNLPEVRKEIEGKGFGTSSVVDTVVEIQNIFSTVRLILALVGAIALLVAGLGMFNTLTISLLERTREIGLLKAMGMKSGEVRELFLAESMIMSLCGGLLGLLAGLIGGKLLELGLSIYSLMNGRGYLSIVNIPILFVVSIILISFLVGIITGIYPATRATKISALNALRYE